MRTFKPSNGNGQPISKESTSIKTPTNGVEASIDLTTSSTYRRQNSQQAGIKANGANGNFYFTQNPDELRGEFIKTSLMKTSHGFGFTIIGANETSEDFLQIKYIVPDGAADRDGLLRQGDVLVYVNNECVLGYTHQDVVEIFQVIQGSQIYTLFTIHQRQMIF